MQTHARARTRAFEKITCAYSITVTYFFFIISYALFILSNVHALIFFLRNKTGLLIIKKKKKNHLSTKRIKQKVSKFLKCLELKCLRLCTHNRACTSCANAIQLPESSLALFAPRTRGQVVRLQTHSDHACANGLATFPLRVDYFPL